jgi:hypothetical protein
METKYIYSIRKQPFEIWITDTKICVRDSRDDHMIGIWNKTNFSKYLHGVFLAKISSSGSGSRTYLYVDNMGVYTFKCRVKLIDFRCPIHAGVQYPYAMSKKWICLLTLGVFLQRKEVLEQDPYDFYFSNYDSLLPVQMCSYKKRTIIKTMDFNVSTIYNEQELNDLPTEDVIDLGLEDNDVVEFIYKLMRKIKPIPKKKKKCKDG